jgi:hypothetical protein
MLARRYSALVAFGVLVGSVMAADSARLLAQDRESPGPNLSGRWDLNRDLSENGETKLARMQSSQGGGHGPGRHGGGTGGSGGGLNTQMEEARGLFLNAPPWFVLTQDGERIVLTDSDGRVRTLTANGQKVRAGARDVRTKWDKHRLVSEISLSDGKLTETYERSSTAAQLIVTTKLDIRGHDVSVRRVYDARSER